MLEGTTKTAKARSSRSMPIDSRNKVNATPKLCSCEFTFGPRDPSSTGKHGCGQRENVESLPYHPFLTLHSRLLHDYVIRTGIDLTSQRAKNCELVVKQGNESRRLAVERAAAAKELAAARQKRAAEEKVVKAKREAESKEFRRLAAERSISFLSFKYGRSVEERCNIGSNWTDLEILPWPRLIQPTETSHSIVRPSTNTDQASSVFQPTTILIPTRNQLHNEIQPSPVFESVSEISVPTTRSRARAQLDKIESFNTTPSPPSLVPDESVASDEEMDDHGIKIADGGVGKDISDTIWQLSDFQGAIHGYRPGLEQGLQKTLTDIGQSLAKIHDKASDPNNPLQNVRIAPEVIDYVEDGRNPDIFTRDFVDLVLRGNAVFNGKREAFRNFSQVFAKALSDNFDGMDDEIDMIMDNADMKRDKSTGEYVGKLQNGTSPRENGTGSTIRENGNGIRH